VYIFSNTKQIGIVKIGRTNRDPAVRADHLSRQTGSIGNFKVEWFKEVEDAVAIEKLLHYVFRHFHLQKEYFAIGVPFAKEIAEKTIQGIEDIEEKVFEGLEPQNISLNEAIEAIQTALKFSSATKDDIALKEALLDLERQKVKLGELQEQEGRNRG